jgi:hypothetical protein
MTTLQRLKKTPNLAFQYKSGTGIAQNRAKRQMQAKDHEA